ncbi:hypothetical protein IFM89_028302 [Coptis chinensis]|uniref:Uncharacterized protein n=1 Tax=Coptis chinensis TaxID=261450 RepID=A0A835HKP2_9MAGN|nr:hypothetical protein IFM89_028302 [Coptis chinensis]
MYEPINKEWMSEKERGDLMIHSMGVEIFEHHLVSNGIEKSYCVWTLHGEDLSNIAVHPLVVANIGETTIGDVAIEMEDIEEETRGRSGLGWETLLTLLLDCMKELWVMATGTEFDEPYVLNRT